MKIFFFKKHFTTFNGLNLVQTFYHQFRMSMRCAETSFYQSRKLIPCRTSKFKFLMRYVCLQNVQCMLIPLFYLLLMNFELHSEDFRNFFDFMLKSNAFNHIHKKLSIYETLQVAPSVIWPEITFHMGSVWHKNINNQALKK